MPTTMVTSPSADASRPADPWTDPVAERLARLRSRIAGAAARSGRAPAEVALVAVSKEFPVAAVLAACAAGQRDFGENRAQALGRKARMVEPGTVRWHFVGRLQRNKAKDVVATAALVHSVDRGALAEAIARAATAQGTVQPVLVQVNVAGDPVKGGCAAPDVAPLVEAIARLDGVACEGLMTMPPFGEDPRPHFAGLRRLRDDLQRDHPSVRHLSMGMTGDFEVAIEEGATIVRLGEAVFGPRPRKHHREEHER